MDKDAIDKEALRKRFKNASDAELEAALKLRREMSNVAHKIVTKHEQKLRRSNCIIAYATAVTAVATTIAAVAVCLQYCQTRNAHNESRQPAASIAPTLSPSP
jgi:negative regulator of sigma E activity